MIIHQNSSKGTLKMGGFYCLLSDTLTLEKLLKKKNRPAQALLVHKHPPRPKLCPSGAWCPLSLHQAFLSLGFPEGL